MIKIRFNHQDKILCRDVLSSSEFIECLIFSIKSHRLQMDLRRTISQRAKIAPQLAGQTFANLCFQGNTLRWAPIGGDLT